MSNLLAIFVTVALILLFPVFIFWMLVRAIRIPGTRWWGIVILLSILTCYCTTFAALGGLFIGGSATGSAALEQMYCKQFRAMLAQTEDLSEALAGMDAASASEAYRIAPPEKDLRFRYVWLLGGCFLFAFANLMLFGPGRREHRHAADCSVAIFAALVVFLTGVWQIAWGSGYAHQAAFYRRMLTDWHRGVQPDAIRLSNAEIAAKLSDETSVRSLLDLENAFRELEAEAGKASGTKEPGTDGGGKTPSGGIAIIGGADGPTAIVVGAGSEQAPEQEKDDTPAEGEAEQP